MRQFHWDREGENDDRSSCWVRVGQAWSGAAWGAQFAPRIGQEVLVKFFEGDPDQPFIAGAVYNGMNRSPIELPLDKTKSTVKTDSSLGGGGSNELRFEDAKDLEEIYLHAQKDEQIEVLNDKTQQVRANEGLQVDKDRSIEVKGSQALRVEESDDSKIDMHQKLTVTGDRTTQVGLDHIEGIGGAQSLKVDGMRSVWVEASSAETIGAAAALTVGGGYLVNVGGVLNTTVGAVLTRQVGGAHIEVVGAARHQQVVKDSSAKIGGDFATEVKGQIKLETQADQEEDVSGKTEMAAAEPVNWLAESFQLEAAKLSIVIGGKRMLSIDKSGKMKLGVSTVTVDGQTIGLKGSKISKVSGGPPASGAASVTQLQAMRQGGASVKVKIVDPEGRPVGNLRVRVEMSDGSVQMVRTDAQGGATLGTQGGQREDIPTGPGRGCLGAEAMTRTPSVRKMIGVEARS